MNVIVTGASKGIGKAIAEIFAANGHNLFLCSRGELSLYKTVEELMTKFPDAAIKARPFDLSKKEEAIAFGNWCLSFAVPDILVNNAGFFEPGSVHNEPDGLLESQMACNVYSAYHVSRTVLPKMMERISTTAKAGQAGSPKGSGHAGRGHIFNICSIASLHAYANGGAYSISKYALHGFSKNLREEMKPFNIKVTSVFPGAVLTDAWGNFDNSSHRMMEANDIAKMIYAAATLSPGACVEDIVMRPQLGDL
ncbi:MAG TPA: SDR family oxidoreductase [Chitinophagaceae bacterium]